MRVSAIALCSSLVFLLAASELPRAASAGEEETVRVLAAWQGQGRTVQTGPHEATFVGSLSGPMYVETEKGLIKSGQMTCPALLTIGLKDGKQRGEGHCAITAKDGAEIYADVTCTGVYLVGCDGDLKLTGGTKQFTGISGGGKVTIRSDSRQIAISSDNSAKEEGTGSLFVPELRYKLP